jgi:hypothetical protein
MRKGHLATKNSTTNSRQMPFPHYKILIGHEIKYNLLRPFKLYFQSEKRTVHFSNFYSVIKKLWRIFHNTIFFHNTSEIS